MTQGSRNVGVGEHARHLERIGATEIGARTELDHTTFRVVVPAQGLALALWLESDRMTSMLERLDQRTLDRLRSALLREHEARDRRSFEELSRWLITQRLYAEDHPYRDAGDDERDLQAIRLEHVQWFFQRHYAPWNARLAIVGDFEVDEARELVERYFSTIRSSFGPVEGPRPTLAETPFVARYVTYGWQAEHTSMVLAWRSPPGSVRDDAVLDIVAEVLAGRPGSRLHRRLVQRDGTVSAVAAVQRSHELESLFTIVVSPLDGDRELLAITAAIDGELQQLVADSPSAAELETARESCRARLVLRARDLAERAAALSAHGSAVERQLSEYDTITDQDVAEVSAQILTPTRRLAIFFDHWPYAPPGGAIIGDEVQR